MHDFRNSVASRHPAARGAEVRMTRWSPVPLGLAGRAMVRRASSHMSLQSRGRSDVQGELGAASAPETGGEVGGSACLAATGAGGASPEGAAPDGPGDFPRIDSALRWASRMLARRGGYALLFLLLFAATWMPIMVTILAAGKSMIWSYDGLSQQYVWFVYTGQWLREVASNVFVSHTFAIPQWTMDSGYGVDTFTSLLGTLANPFYWVSAVVPERYAEFAFEFMTLLNVYLAGLAFSGWAMHRGCSRSSTMVAALCYVFAGNVIVMFTQANFMFNLLIGPIVLMGTDRVFERRGVGLFVVAMTWSLMVSFYDSYMLIILLVVYCLAAFFGWVDAGRPRSGRAVRLLGWFGMFVLLIAVSVLASCVLMLPQALSLTGDERMSVSRSDALLYGLDYYQRALTGLITSFFIGDYGSDAYGGVNAFAALALVMLVIRRRQHKGLFVVFVVFTVMMLLPFFGRLMNGMQYPACRWVWAYDIMVSYVVALLMPEMLRATRRERLTLAVVTVVYGAVCLILPLPSRSITFAIAYVVLVGLLAVVLSGRAWNRRRLVGAVATLVMTSAAVTFCCALSPYFSNQVSTFVGFNKAWSFHTSNNVAGLIDQTEGYDDSYRYDRDTFTATAIHNSNLITGHMSPDFYNSLYSQYVDDFNTSLGLVDTEGLNYRYGALNGRSELEALLGVKYYYLTAGYEALLPYSFRNGLVVASGDTMGGMHSLYETDEVAPLAFVTNSYITTDEYEALGQVDRGDALLDAIVLDESDVTSGMSDVAGQVGDNSTDVPYEIVDAKDVDIDGNTITTKGDHASITLKFDSPTDAETYVAFTGLTFTDTDLLEQVSHKYWESLGFIGRMKARIANVFDAKTSAGCIVCEVGDKSSVQASRLYVPSKDSNTYSGKQDFVCNLGYSAEGATTVKIEFSSQGRYSFDTMSVRALSMGDFDQRVDKLIDAGATDIEFGTNTISATATSETDGQLFLSVAYADGWTATVDGQPAQVHRADLGFMSVDVPAGTHRVVLSYTSPHLVLGAKLSVVGIVLGVVVCVTVNRRNRRAGQLPASDAA